MFLDTTILVDIARGDNKVLNHVKKIAEKENFLLSVVQIGELADWCHANKLDAIKVVNDIKRIAAVANITEDICLKGSEIKQKQRKAGIENFSLIDGIIFASAMNFGEALLTKDRDFEGLEGVILI